LGFSFGIHDGVDGHFGGSSARMSLSSGLTIAVSRLRLEKTELRETSREFFALSAAC